MQKKQPSTLKARFGDKASEEIVIKSFERYAYDSLGWEWQEIQSRATDLLLIGSPNSLESFFDAFQSERVLKRFFKDNYEKDKRENVQIETLYPLDAKRYEFLLQEYNTEYISLSAILITSYADFDPEPLVYFRKWINISNPILNRLSKEKITKLFYKTTSKYLSTKYNKDINIDCEFSRKGYLSPTEGMRLFYSL